MARVLPLPTILHTDILKSASDCIHGGGVLAVPTESSYALAAGFQYETAIRRVHEMKGERGNKPILLLVGSIAQAFRVVSSISPVAESLMNRFWPGPLTLILPAVTELSELLTRETSTIGIRQPQQPQLLQLLETTGPLTGTSANRSGKAPTTTAEEITQEFGTEVDLILDGGTLPGSLPSTVLSLAGDYRILRPGPIPAQAIQDALRLHGSQLQSLPH